MLRLLKDTKIQSKLLHIQSQATFSIFLSVNKQRKGCTMVYSKTFNSTSCEQTTKGSKQKHLIQQQTYFANNSTLTIENNIIHRKSKQSRIRHGAARQPQHGCLQPTTSHPTI
jgi:hypothetical protein